MEQLDKGRRLARRRMAWMSFAFLVATGSLIVGSLTLREDPTLVASALATASGPLVGVLTVFVAIVLGYLGISGAERMFKRD